MESEELIKVTNPELYNEIKYKWDKIKDPRPPTALIEFGEVWTRKLFFDKLAHELEVMSYYPPHESITNMLLNNEYCAGLYRSKNDVFSVDSSPIKESVFGLWTDSDGKSYINNYPLLLSIITYLTSEKLILSFKISVGAISTKELLNIKNGVIEDLTISYCADILRDEHTARKLAEVAFEEVESYYINRHPSLNDHGYSHIHVPWALHRKEYGESWWSIILSTQWSNYYILHAIRAIFRESENNFYSNNERLEALYKNERVTLVPKITEFYSLRCYMQFIQQLPLESDKIRFIDYYAYCLFRLHQQNIEISIRTIFFLSGRNLFKVLLVAFIRIAKQHNFSYEAEDIVEFVTEGCRYEVLKTVLVSIDDDIKNDLDHIKVLCWLYAYLEYPKTTRNEEIMYIAQPWLKRVDNIVNHMYTYFHYSRYRVDTRLSLTELILNEPRPNHSAILEHRKR